MPSAVISNRPLDVIASEAIQSNIGRLDCLVAGLLVMRDFRASVESYSAQQNIPGIPIRCLAFCLLRFRAAKGMLSPAKQKY
jgi:hypothetical protein